MTDAAKSGARPPAATQPLGAQPLGAQPLGAQPTAGVSALAWAARQRSLARMIERTARDCGLQATTEVVNRALERASAEVERNARLPVRRAMDPEGRPASALPGSRVVMDSAHAGGRVGTVVEVRGTSTDPGYLVEWTDGDRSLLYPGSGTVILPPPAVS